MNVEYNVILGDQQRRIQRVETFETFEAAIQLWRDENSKYAFSRIAIEMGDHCIYLDGIAEVTV